MEVLWLQVVGTDFGWLKGKNYQEDQKLVLDLRQLQQRGTRNATDGPQQEQSGQVEWMPVLLQTYITGSGVKVLEESTRLMACPLTGYIRPFWEVLRTPSGLASRRAASCNHISTKITHTHREERLFPKKNSGCSLEELMNIGWPNIPFLVLENGRGATGRNVHRMDCHPQNRVHLQHMLQPHSWVWGPNQGQQFANAFVLWICENLIYELNIIDIIWLAFSLKEINIVICVAGLFIGSIWIFFNENFIFSLSSLSSVPMIIYYYGVSFLNWALKLTRKKVH